MNSQELAGWQSIRTHLVLGRVSNLPTVGSNCLAGWILGGAGDLDRLHQLVAGTGCLYVGGMFLNDAFDAQFDQQHRPERPIPSGSITVKAVWQWGLSWLGLGMLILILLGQTPAILAVLLASAILAYDAVHKIFAFSPVLMALCRLLVILLGASVGADGLTGPSPFGLHDERSGWAAEAARPGLSLWSGLVLASYVLGLSFLARKESVLSPPPYWPCLFLMAPVVLGLIVNRGEFQVRGMILCAGLVIWMLQSLRHIYWTQHRNVGRCISGLLAGIVLVDWLAVGGGPGPAAILFAALFALALLLQRYVPAT